MKVVILAGGRGTRLSEETEARPKPMVEIGGMPLLWHIMKIYSHHGFNEFIICLGYKGHLIKEYFSGYFLHRSDVTFYLKNNSTEVLQSGAVEPWKVTLVDTGLDTPTAGRLLRVAELIGQETFMMTYGDGVADVDIRALAAFHLRHDKVATVTAVRPLGRFGVLDLDGDRVKKFDEKNAVNEGWINGGFFVLGPEVFWHLQPDQMLELGPLGEIAEHDQLRAFRHEGFWQCMDALRDKQRLEELWRDGAPWRVW